MLEHYRIVLGSQSPRRRQLLHELGLPFRVETVKGLPEDYPATLPVSEVAQYLSRQKAVAHRLCPDDLLITADTIVVLDNQILGKPSDIECARSMLRALSGRTHHVITGVSVTTQDTQRSFSDVTEVEFAPLDDEEIEHYVACYSPLDKAGAYGIQEWIGHIGVRRISGCFYNVMGLPVPRLYALLKEFDSTRL